MRGRDHVHHAVRYPGGGRAARGHPHCAVTSWLIDKSAYVRLQLGQVANRDVWDARINRGLVRLSTITRLELGYCARSGDLGRRQFASPPLSLMPIEHLTPAIEDRAFQVQMILADRGQHRAPSIPDLLIAATAEKTGLTVLAVDKDFDLIAAFTGQPVHTLDG
ncbi:MAG TPA: PIN domain nuclease [Rugosimonospora sp.]|nr:PIN domain nuclease [Rugosimonospora sp.]